MEGNAKHSYVKFKANSSVLYHECSMLVEFNYSTLHFVLRSQLACFFKGSSEVFVSRLTHEVALAPSLSSA